jgi:hypothetical protein
MNPQTATEQARLIEHMRKRIAELEAMLKPARRKPGKSRVRKSLPNGKINFTFQFGR